MGFKIIPTAGYQHRRTTFILKEAIFYTDNFRVDEVC